MHDCDLLILLGTDFPYSNFLPRNVKTVQIDIQRTAGPTNAVGALCRLGDVGETLKCLTPAVREERSRDGSSTGC